MRPRRSSRPPSPDAHKRTADRHLDTRTGRAEPQSRRELTSSAVVRGHPAPRHGDRSRPPKRLAAWRLGARKTTPTPPPPARRADRRQTRTGRAKPQSRKELGRSAGVEDFQTVGIGAGRSKPRLRRPDRWPRPQTSLRLCGSARKKQRRPHHHPLGEPIAAKPGQVAQSRRELTSGAVVRGHPARRHGDRSRPPNRLAALSPGA